MTQQQPDTLLQFPCDFPIKIMGKNHVDLETAVVTIVNRHVEHEHRGELTRRESKNGNYLSITITIQAQSKQQLDNIYQELSSHALVMMAL